MKRISLLVLFIISTALMAKSVTVTDIQWDQSDAEAKVVIKLSQSVNVNPVLSVRGNMVQVVLDEAVVWPKIEKVVGYQVDMDSKVMAYQFNKKMVRVRAILPLRVKADVTQISMVQNSNKIELKIPTKFIASKVANAEKSVSKELYDEKFLEELINDKNTKKVADKVLQNSESSEKLLTDEIKSSFSGLKKNVKDVAKNNKKVFSISGYIGKMIAFLGVVLVVFYFGVSLMKKGVMKKGKLGFLNNSNPITVLSTTYIAPKRNLMLVKVHNQVLLLSNSESGISFISDVNDTTGLLKEGEKNVSGDNFDSNLGNASNGNKSFNLKSDISQLAKENNSTLGNVAEVVRDQVKLTDQIKKKVKGLKQFQ